MPPLPTAVVTGASGGIGPWIALGLARAGHAVVLLVRDPARGEAARAWIARRAPGAVTEMECADLSSLAATREAADRVAARHPKLAILVNNAGVYRTRRETTAEGHELVLAVNHLAPFVLTRAMLPALQAGAPARIVTIGSEMSDRARLDLNDLELARHWGPGGIEAYGRSKLAVMMATFEWARRLDGTGVTANVVHPGTVATNIGQRPGVAGIGWQLLKPFLLRPEAGADGPLHVALAHELAGVTGRYFKRRREAMPNPAARDPAPVARLWAETERLTGAESRRGGDPSATT